MKQVNDMLKGETIASSVKYHL